jgi:activator of 2-hydroxyglutaryl-CoA dehydratase
MLNRVGFGDTVAFSGGVANNPCIVEMVRQRLDGVRVVVPDNPSIIGALGASIQAERSKTASLSGK